MQIQRAERADAAAQSMIPARFPRDKQRAATSEKEKVKKYTPNHDFF